MLQIDPRGLALLGILVLLGCGTSEEMARPPSTAAEPAPVATPADENPPPAAERTADDPLPVESVAASPLATGVDTSRLELPVAEAPVPDDIDEILSDYEAEKTRRYLTFIQHENVVIRRKTADVLAIVADFHADAEFADDRIAEEDLEPLVAALCQATRDPDEDVRQSAAKALGNLKGQAVSALPYLMALLSADDDSTQAAAAALGQLGPAAAPAVPTLMHLAEDRSHEAAAALGEIGLPHAQAAIPLLKQRLTRGGYEDATAIALARLGEVEFLIEAAASGQVPIRSSAAQGLGRVRPATDEVVEVLGRLMTDHEKSVRESATNAMQWSAPDLPSKLPYLIAATHDAEKRIREMALRELMTFTPNREKAAFALIDAVSRLDYSEVTGYTDVRQVFAYQRENAPILMEIFFSADHDLSQRKGAGFMLLTARVDQLAEEADRLQELCIDETAPAELRAYADICLHNVDFANKVDPMLVTQLIKRSDEVFAKVDGTRNLPSDADDSTIVLLIELLKHSHPSVVRASVDKLRDIGPPAKAALPTLREIAADSKNSNAGMAKYTITKIDPGGDDQ